MARWQITITLTDTPDPGEELMSGSQIYNEIEKDLNNLSAGLEIDSIEVKELK